MHTRLCKPYRGFGILLTVAEVESASFNGTERRCTVKWSIQTQALRAATIASFQEPVAFTSADEALDYAERRATTFVDSALASAAQLSHGLREA